MAFLYSSAKVNKERDPVARYLGYNINYPENNVKDRKQRPDSNYKRIDVLSFEGSENSVKGTNKRTQKYLNNYLYYPREAFISSRIFS